MPSTPKKTDAEKTVVSIAAPTLIKMIQDIDKDVNKKIDDIDKKIERAFHSTDEKILLLWNEINKLKAGAGTMLNNSSSHKSISSEESKQLAMDFINSMDNRYMVKDNKFQDHRAYVDDAMKWRRFKKFFDAEL